MTILTSNDAVRPALRTAISVAGTFDWLGNVFFELIKSYKRHRDRQIAIAMLHGFSDYELKDIGLPRSAIEAAVCGHYHGPNAFFEWHESRNPIHDR